MAQMSGTPETAVAERAAPRTPKAVGIVWLLLGINTLGSAGAKTIVPLPRSLIQLITMGSLAAAFALALALNPRLRIKPSTFVFLLTLLLVPSLISTVHQQVGAGALFRCGRLALFVATLWLLTCWWDGSLRFVRYHIRMYAGILVSVVAGLAISPGAAMPELYGGRLVGALWPLTPPQIGQYTAVIIGLTVLLLVGRQVDRTSAAIVIVPCLALLAMTHTRTATVGLLAGLTLAICSLLLTSAAARRFFGWAVLVVTIAAVGFASALQAWFLRGQTQEYFTSLTGRAKVWDALLSAPRTGSEQFFGTGMGDKSYGGLPIDNSWLAAYNEQGLIGVTLVAAVVLVLGAVALLRPPSLPRACAIFLISYVALSSYTEAGLGDASPYLLHLALAATLLATPTAAGPFPTPAVPRRRVPRWARDREVM
ncbi:O-antigen ligase domain-containing protein [Streptomyces sp. WG-D5]